VFVAVLWTLSGQPVSAESHATFTITSDPTVAVLRLSQEGGFLSGWDRFTLYGDGRLVRELLDPGLKNSRDTAEKHLSFEDTTDLMDQAVSAGLLEYSQSDQSPEAAAFYNSDLPNTVLQIRLESYSGSDDGEAGTYRTIRVHAVHELVSRIDPDHQAARDLLELHARLRDMFGLNTHVPGAVDE